MTVTPGLPEIIDDAIEVYARDRLFTALPGQITKIYPDRQFVDVKPSIANMLPNDDETRRATKESFELEEWPTIPHTPVGYYQGGGFFVTVPIKVGDHVLIVCCQRSLDRWVETARKSRIAAINPADVGTHVLDCAVAIPVGPAPKADLLQSSSVSADDLVCGRDGGAVIRIKPSGEIHIGANATHSIPADDKIQAELSRIQGDIQKFVSMFTSWIVVPQDGGAALKTIAGTTLVGVPSSPGPTASSKGKVE